RDAACVARGQARCRVSARGARSRRSRGPHRARLGYTQAVDQVATVFLNGAFMPLSEAKVPVLDRGFIFGDGVYEVVPVYSKVPFRQLAAEADAVETILFRDGKLTEASSSNVFVVKGGVIQSPPKNQLILPGITYDVVVELARANALPLEFRDISEAEVRGADE